jgi:alpha-galactosidase
VVENCGDNNNGPPDDRVHWSPPLPSDLEGEKCDSKGQFYRVSTDIAPQFYSAMRNLQYTVKYSSKDLPAPLSRPGCWAYPDMLQVGQLATKEEDRSHFGAWCVVSAPLVLGFDLTNATTTFLTSTTVKNEMAIEVNQQWAGHPGTLVRNSTATFVALTASGAAGECESEKGRARCKKVTVPTYQIWSKPQPDGAVAVFVVNLSEEPNAETITVTLQELGMNLPAGVTRVNATDIWAQDRIGEVGSLVVEAHSLASHDSVFQLLEPETLLSRYARHWEGHKSEEWERKRREREREGEGGNN